MPQGPNKNDVSKTSAGIVFSNPGNTPTNPLAGQPVSVTAVGTQKNVQGQLSTPLATVIVSNPA
jgi:hypothetical protein